jgi:uracil-DNA glycosylase family 4
MRVTDMLPSSDAASLLRWYAAMGVDIAVDEAPHDRFAESAALRGPPPEAVAAQQTRAAPNVLAPRATATIQTADTVALDAVEQAEGAADLADLQARFEAFDGCALKTTAGHFVGSSGAAGARLMLVGDVPGDEEDRTGHVFAGEAGALLDRMLAAIGLSRADVYLTHVVPWRPPGNRTPNPLETAACLPFMHRQIELVAPHIIVPLGQASAQWLLGGKESLMRLRGRWLAYPGRAGEVRTRVLMHPRLLLETPIYKRLAWQDLQQIAQALEAEK